MDLARVFSITHRTPQTWCLQTFIYSVCYNISFLKKLPSLSDVQNNLDKFFEVKSEEFYRRGIEMLPGRWEQITKIMTNILSIKKEYMFKKVYLHFLFKNRTNFPDDLIFSTQFIYFVKQRD